MHAASKRIEEFSAIVFNVYYARMFDSVLKKENPQNAFF